MRSRAILCLLPCPTFGNNPRRCTVPVPSFPLMLRLLPQKALVGVLAVLVSLASCDNVGRAFDPDVTPPITSPTVVSTIQVLPVGGDARDGRPIVRQTYPKGGGWPATVPVVVEFSESMNEASLLPTTPTANDAKVVLRPASTQTSVPVIYSFLAGSRVLVMRPVAALDSPQATSYDVVLLAGGRDADGVRFSASTETVLATFTVDPAATADASILAVYPRDNQRDNQRDTDFLCVFTRPVNLASLVNNFTLREQGGANIVGTPSLPLSVTNLPEARVVGFRPASNALWQASTTFEFVVNASITFGTTGVLQFSNRTPFSRFTTGGPPNPTSIAVDNLSVGFPHKVNLANLATLRLAVVLPADAAAGDVVNARVYGSNRSTTATGDIALVQRNATLLAAGAQTVVVDFSGTLGSIGRLLFDDGAITFTAQLFRGSQHSGAVRGNNAAAQDTVRPTLVSLGPPTGSNGTDLYAELETMTLFGTASEALGDASFVLNTPAPVTGGLFASRTNGTFLLAPVAVGRRTTALGYSLSITDLAGNLAAAPATGNVLQRGVLAGSASGGSLVVEAFDAATLRAVGDVEVLVDPGVPTVPPAIGRQTALTGSDGRATFTGLTAGTHTITLVKPGYDLITLYDSPVGFASLPMRTTSATIAVATLTGSVTFPATVPGASAIVGSNLLDDPATLTIRTSTGTPTALAATAIRPNRPMMFSAFGGVFEPTANPAFLVHACNLCGTDLVSPTPPVAPVAAGATQTLTAALRDVGSLFATLVPYSGNDFTSSNGFLATSLSAPATVRMVATIDGFIGQGAIGIGFPTGSAASITANGAWSTAILTGISSFAPLSWVVCEARDTAGGISRTRAQLDATTGTASVPVLPQDLHLQDIGASTTLTSPPRIELYDALDTALVETTTVGQLATGLLGAYDLVAVDATGRGWVLIAEDTDAGTATPTLRAWQFPAPAANPTIALGAWVVTPYARLFRAGSAGVADWVLEERRHREVTMTRAPAIPYTLQ